MHFNSAGFVMFVMFRKYKKRSGEERCNIKESILLLAYKVQQRITEGSRLLKSHIIMVTFFTAHFYYHWISLL